MPHVDTKGAKDDVAATAKLMVVLLGLAWGFNWIATRIVLEGLSPWTLRTIGIGLGAATLFAAAALRGIPLSVPRAERMKIVIAGFFNIAVFGVCSAYSQVYGTTSRAVVIAYSMPIWAALLARIVLKERLNAVKLVALILCAAGLAILIWPLARIGLPLGAFLALGCALTWAVGTIYLKWAKLTVPAMTSAAWQLLVGTLMLAAGMLAFDGLPQLWPLPPRILVWLVYTGVIGMGLAYFLWFEVVGRLPTTTASVGSLLVPVVGVIASAVMNGERPSLNDIIGFALIFTAAACVLLQPNVQHTELPE